MRFHFLHTTATDIAALGAQLQTDVIAWGYACLAVIFVAVTVLWVRRFFGF